MYIAKILFFLSVPFIVYAETEGFSKKCENPKPIEYFDGKLCASRTWYLYAGSVECENCCFIRNTTLLERELFSVTDTLTENGEKMVRNYIARKEPNHSVFRTLDDGKKTILMDTDCENYAVLYEPIDNVFQVFTSKREINQSSLSTLEGVRNCNMTLYYYNPHLSC